MTYYTDFYSGGEVNVQLPPGGGMFQERPTTLRIQMADVTRQEGDAQPLAGPHQTLSVSVWFQRLNGFLPVVVFTTNVLGHEIGKPMLENTPVFIRGSDGSTIMENFFIVPNFIVIPDRPRVQSPEDESTERDVMEVDLSLAGGFQQINLPFSAIPTAGHPCSYMRNFDDLFFKLPSFKIELRGFAPFKVEDSSMPLPSGWNQKIEPAGGNARARLAWVDFKLYSGLQVLGFAQFRFVGTLNTDMKRTATHS